MQLFRRIANLFSRSRLDREIKAEIDAHINLRIDDNIAAGMSPGQARRNALLRFGNPTATREQVASADLALSLESVWSDLHYATRQLRRSPGFTLTAVLTLALAIGANAVVFSVLDAFLLRPLNVPHAESLYGIWRTATNDMAQSYPDYLDLRDRNHSFESLVAYDITLVGLDAGKNPSRAWIEGASGNYFDALGLQPYLGRLFHSSDEHGPNSAPYIVLTYAFWHSHFHDDRSIVGRVVKLNKHPFTIIGVAPPEFHGTLSFFHPDLFVPIVNHPMLGEEDLNARGNRWVFMALGHLKPGVSPTQAIADLNSIGTFLEKTYPKDDGKMTFTLEHPGLYGDYVGRPLRMFMTGLMLLAGLILLAACANLGTLFAARAADRSREVALRLALGSSRRRILRGLFTEAVMIALLGGAAGLLGSIVLLRELSAWQPVSRWPLHMSVNPDATVYAVALLLALASGLLFGAVPLRQVLRTNPYEVVKAGVAAGGPGRFGLRMTGRDVLLALQIAICAVLVTSSIVAVRGLARSLHDDFGFDVRNTLLVETDLAMAGYRRDAVPATQKQMIEALKTIPGVQSVAMADEVPLGDARPDSPVFTDATSDLRPANAAADALMFKVSPEYFHAAGTVLLSGRAFTWQDNNSSGYVAVVNREFARKIFGSLPKAMGSYFKMPEGKRVHVVGVTGDGKYGNMNEDPKPVMFLALLQWPSSSGYLVVRSSGDANQLGLAIRSRLRELDAALPVYVQTRYASLDAFLLGPRMATLSLGVLGMMGAMLSITGIFGMAAYSVSKRLRELGIRIALGAKRTEVLRAALGRAVKLLAIGSSAGLLLGILASRVLAFIVSQATPRDPLVLAGVVLVMSTLGVLATWIPAHRALSVNPVILLREE
jgi:predicted permease